MHRLAEELESNCGIDGKYLMIGFFINEKNDWSFAFGEAQYVTGKL